MSDSGIPVGIVGDPGTSEQGFGTPFVEGDGQFMWFDALAFLRFMVGQDDPRYQFWCKTCGGQMGPVLLNMTTFAAEPAPFCQGFDALDVASSAADFQCPGSCNPLCAAAFQWILSLFYHYVTGLPEHKSCGGTE